MTYDYEHKEGEPGKWYYSIFRKHGDARIATDWQEEIAIAETEEHAILITDALNTAVKVEEVRQWLIDTAYSGPVMGKSPFAQAYPDIVTAIELEKNHNRP